MNNKKNSIIGYLLIFFIGCLAMYAVVFFFPVVVTESITRTEKDVTVTESGIADAVEKVVDSVVIVSVYKNDMYVGAGTGFVYQKNNNTYYIMTNCHVVSAGTKITATFKDGTTLETKVLGADEYGDIAVISVESKKELSVASIGSSDKSRVGDTVFTVGAPINNAYSWSVTRGIVSGKDRLIEVNVGNSGYNKYVMKVLQTDAAINSGNSGGPLCNSNGEVIGITSMKLVSTGVESMSFALPIDEAMDKAASLINNEKIDYPYMGITMLDFNVAYYSIQYYDLIKNSNLSGGVIVQSVEKNTGAAKAGMKENDIIVAIDGHEVNNTAYLRYYLFQHHVGDNMKATVYRDGKKQDLTLTLGTSKQAS